MVPQHKTSLHQITQPSWIQQVIGIFLYYDRAVDNTILPGLSAILSEQSNGLNYLTTHPSVKVIFHASSMILNIHSGASYLSEP